MVFFNYHIVHYLVPGLQFANWEAVEDVYCKNSKGEEFGISLKECQSLCMSLKYCVGVSFTTKRGAGISNECNFCLDEDMVHGKIYDFYRRPGNVQKNLSSVYQRYFDLIKSVTTPVLKCYRMIGLSVNKNDSVESIPTSWPIPKSFPKTIRKPRREQNIAASNGK